MRKRLLLLLLFPLTLCAQFIESRSSLLCSLQMSVNGDTDNMPVITLGSDDEITFSFDELSHTYRRYIYHIVHCNSDWEPSEFFSIDYLDGFNDRPIEFWENSENTTQLYTRYEVTLPNEDVSLKASGNYRLEVFDEDDDDEPVAVFSFAVVERKVFLSAEVSGNTDVDFNKTHQQLAFKIGYSGYNILAPATDIKPVVYQNRRFDNRVSMLKPTYITGNTLEYVNNSELIFDAGNEYRRFELTDPYSPGMNVERISYFDPYYHAELYGDVVRKNHENTRDENGRFFINTLEGYGSELEADYALVHFRLEAPYRSGGHYYLLGDAWGNGFGDANIMQYDRSEGAYLATCLLKFGLYNYQYVWLPENSQRAYTAPCEGDFYKTENEYLIMVYHREFGGRYDKLIGVLQINYDLEKN